MNRAQKKQANLLRPTRKQYSANSLKSYGFASGFPRNAVMDNTELIQTEYILKKERHVFEMCTEKLKQAATIVRENEKRFIANQRKVMDTTDRMNEIDKELMMYEANIHNLLRPTRKQYSVNSLKSGGEAVGFPHIFVRDCVSPENCGFTTSCAQAVPRKSLNLLQGVAESNGRNFDQLTVDELIHLYWEVDESSISDEVENSYKNVDPLDSEFEFNPEFEF